MVRWPLALQFIRYHALLMATVLNIIITSSIIKAATVCKNHSFVFVGGCLVFCVAPNLNWSKLFHVRWLLRHSPKKSTNHYSKSFRLSCVHGCERAYGLNLNAMIDRAVSAQNGIHINFLLIIWRQISNAGERVRVLLSRNGIWVVRSLTDLKPNVFGAAFPHGSKIYKCIRAHYRRSPKYMQQSTKIFSFLKLLCRSILSLLTQ